MFRKIVRHFVLSIVIVITIMLTASALLLAGGDTQNLSTASYAARENRFSIVAWEIQNAPSKWLHRAYTGLPWTDTSDEHRRAAFNRYVELSEEYYRARDRLERAVAASEDKEEARIQVEMDRLDKERLSLRDSTEEYIEGEIAAVLIENGFGSENGFMWPPLDIRLGSSTRVLITSPRDRILIEEALLIDPEVTIAESENIEKALLQNNDLSAVVLRGGGVATYPAQVSQEFGLRTIFEIATHEWLHGYLFFKPLGRGYFADRRITEINEVLAGFFGQELGRIAYNRVTGDYVNPVQPPPDPDPEISSEQPAQTATFDFISFMRETRLEVEELLLEHLVEEAEAYMERRRVVLLEEHGIHIRKLNQAYFAFNGNYSSTGASISQVPRQIWAIREREGSIADAVRIIEGVSTPEEFTDLLQRLGIPHE